MCWWVVAGRVMCGSSTGWRGWGTGRWMRGISRGRRGCCGRRWGCGGGGGLRGCRRGGGWWGGGGGGGGGLGWGGGAAFADLRGGVQLWVEGRRLEEGRLCALDQRIEADLRLGRHRELLSELTVLASRYRTHENLHAQFMIALYRSGRR